MLAAPPVADTMIHASHVLYLDFDGVLHPDSAFWSPRRGVFLEGEGQLFMHAPVLERALEPWPDVRLVLSTSWVPMLSFSRARRFLPPNLQARVVGATWHSEFKRDPEQREIWNQQRRHEQIVHDVLRRRPTAWAAVDDDCHDWPLNLERHLVATPSGTGLGDPQAQQRLIQVLADLHAPGRLPIPLPFG